MLLWITLMAACSGDDTGSPGQDSGDPGAAIVWQPVAEDVEEGAFLSVWGGGGGSDAWIVGGQYDAGHVLRGSEGDWRAIELPEGTPLLNWVHGTGSGDSDVWLAGLSGTLLHWDGSSWTDHSVDTEAAFWGLYAHPSGEVIAVGGASRWGGEAAMIWRYDGSTWTELPLPDKLSGLSNLFKVNYVDSEYWLVGAGGAALRGDAEGFRAVATGYAGDLVTVTSSASSLVAVGGRGTGVIAEPSGDGLSVVAEVNAGLNGVWRTPAGTAVVVGERGFSGLYDQNTGTFTEAPSVTLDILHATWGEAGGTMYAVGGNLNTSEEYFKGSIWRAAAPPN